MTERKDSIAQEVERLRGFLRTYVEKSGIPRGTVARNAELSEEELAEILREDGSPLEIEQIHAVLVALDVESGDFYAELYGLDKK